MAKKIKCSGTDVMVCPYCGFGCKCGKQFIYHRYTEVYYSTIGMDGK